VAQSPTNIDAIPAEPPRYGLIQQLLAPTPDELANRFAQGWTFQPEGCDPTGAEALVCASAVTADTEMDRPGTIEGFPVWLWAEDRCSTFGFFSRNWNGRVRNALAVKQSYDLARELWEGNASQLGGLGNFYLSAPDANEVTTSAKAVGKALGCLEAALATGLAGGMGLIHITPQALMHAVTMNVVRFDSGTWRTPMGTQVIADAGYSGAGPGNVPAGETQWAYATAMMRVWLAEVIVRPNSTDDREALAASMDVETNLVVVRAGRLAMVGHANECVHAAAELDLPVCGYGTGS